MSESVFRYDKMVEDALKGVVRQCLVQVAKRGALPGQHHFYITYRTRHPGVVLPEHLRARYPEEITIVIQHQFWNLEVGEDGFSVGLSFGGVRETLVVPFAAVTAFADPSCKFGLQFQTEAAADPKSKTEPPAARPLPAKENGDKVVALDAFRKK
ncbi:MAG: hypothetical protein EPN26_09560 [Rhodospirillales bacterium]|nr:MAG: hypothetical protein EPN26_09560 [Rhodospirillales bacterium]